MSTVKHYIANSTGELNKFKKLIATSLDEVIPIVEDELNASQIDIIFISAAMLAIPEYGIGGSSPGPNHIYVSFDPYSDRITQQGLNETLFHEIHHCIRWRDPGYGDTLGEAMVSEGLACLYEEQHSGKVPIYAKVNIKDEHIHKAKELLGSKNYDHSEWFFGSKNIERWFGYNACKHYANINNKKASDLVDIPANAILKAYAK